MAHPARAQAKLGRLHHHLIAHNRGVDRSRIHLVVRTHPRVIVHAAHQQHHRRPKNRSVARETRLAGRCLLEQLGRGARQNAHGMIVARRGSKAPSFKNGIELLGLDSAFLVFAAGVALKSQIGKRHGTSLLFRRLAEHNGQLSLLQV